MNAAVLSEVYKYNTSNVRRMNWCLFHSKWMPRFPWGLSWSRCFSFPFSHLQWWLLSRTTSPQQLVSSFFGGLIVLQVFNWCKLINFLLCLQRRVASKVWRFMALVVIILMAAGATVNQIRNTFKVTASNLPFEIRCQDIWFPVGKYHIVFYIGIQYSFPV